MKYFHLALVAIFIFSCFSFASGQDIKEVNVTIYNNDLGVVREIRALDIQEGISEIEITRVAERIDPTSVHINFDGIVLEQNYQYDLVSLGKILNKYIDKKIDLITDNDVISGTLLSSAKSIVIEKNDGGLLLIPNYDDYRISVGKLPEGLITRPTLIWKVNSNKSGKNDIGLTYHTGGMSWHTEYVALLNEDDTKMDLNAWISIDNKSGATYKNANLKLVAGDINRIREDKYKYIQTLSRTESEDSFVEKEFFEYHMYNLQRPSTLANNEIKQISLFEASNVNIQKKYIYKSSTYSQTGNVSVFVEYLNSKSNNLGMPMPKGKVRLNKFDGSNIEFIGEDMINHTPKDEKIILKVGDAFDIKAEEKIIKTEKISNNVHEKIFEIKLRNHKSENVIIEVEKNLGTNWEILESSLKYKVKDAMTIKFDVPVKQDEEKILRFKVRYKL
jgi:hypothetical protein